MVRVQQFEPVTDSSPEVLNWGLVDYPSGLERQLALVEQVAAGESEKIIFCTHPPVVTLGRASLAGDLSGWQGDVVSVSRGGRATYHGPSQLVVYPILDLKKPRAHFRSKDLHSYLHALEVWVSRALHSVGVELAKPGRVQIVKEKPSRTGVWVGERKIASIGIAVRKWISYHGVAINLSTDPNAFRGISPCGFTTETMTSVERELGRALTYEQMRERLVQELDLLVGVN